MSIGVALITGCMLGVELYNDPLEGNGLIIDLFILRFIFDWSEV